MCCLFTCCAWCVDLIQRCWTFTMSCCICMAVCCVLVVASIAGVALGYNYSLAEYIELKETNVSVYLKRGVFDDEFVNEVDWRRSGGGGPPAAAPEAQRSGAQADNRLYGSGRRTGESVFDEPETTKIDENIYVGQDRSKFEGSLLKLTARPTVMDALVTLTIYPEPFVAQPNEGFPRGAAVVNSAEDMRAVQSLINRRKMDSTKNPYHGAGYWNGNEQMSELESIKSVLDEKREGARKYATVLPTTVIDNHPDGRTYDTFTTKPPDVDSRRMMATDNIMSLVREQENQKPPKWYEPKPPPPTSLEDLINVPIVSTPRLGPVTPKNSYPTQPTQVAVRPTLTNHRRMGNPFLKDKDYQDLTFKDYSDVEISGVPIRKKRSLNPALKAVGSSFVTPENIEDITRIEAENQSRRGFLDKFLAIIEIVNPSISFSEEIKSDVSQPNVTVPPDKIPGLNNRNSSNTRNTEILIAKIIKHTIVL